MNVLSSKLLGAFLWVAATLSALCVVWSTNETRALTNQLLTMRAEANSMMVAHGQYLLQERSLTSAAGLEIIAVEELGLYFPAGSDIEVLMPSTHGGLLP